MKATIKYRILKRWYQNCGDLLDIYQNDDSLTMEIEWAILQNYKNISNAMTSYDRLVENLIEKYGSLQPDGTKALDYTDTVLLQQYQKELDDIEEKTARVDIQKIKHKDLKRLKGVTLETMSLFDFMIT